MNRAAWKSLCSGATDESLKIVPAYRVDRIGGDFTNEMTGQDYDINDYGLIKQPKLSVVYSPWKVTSFNANWDRAFQVGTGAAAYKVPPRNEDLSPSINVGWETGVTFTPAGWVDGRVAYWRPWVWQRPQLPWLARPLVGPRDQLAFEVAENRLCS
ncbi:TonB-dependent receptor [Pseudomonas putida JB]|nr:TonB-dependent receptor [Pseudomonas putida JB]MCI1024569.1 TonB-dependent receptor [Pseudomonas putida]PWY44791.1 TonB-dependent receptor [Pseudomonas sp. RW405]TFF51866.1 TonB-dependent receptor [Pseudomonas putida]